MYANLLLKRLTWMLTNSEIRKKLKIAMPPYNGDCPPLNTHSRVTASSPTLDVDEKKDQLDQKQDIIWVNVATFTYGHLAAAYGLYLAVTSAHWATLLLAHILFVLAEVGVTAGAHRLWAHRTYKARRPLQILLMVMNTLAFQNSAITWVRDHRMHHKYSDTELDPHNASRGFFYSHMGWLLVRKSKQVRERQKTIYMQDVLDNPVLKFQKKYAIPFIGSVCFVLPTIIPVLCWDEALSTAWHVTMLRYLCNLHITFLVNSAAHAWGNKPYDSGIRPVQSIPVSFVAFGEGWHNYHHVFPWDYRAAELGNNRLNFTTKFIDFFAWVGWAYDLKSVPDEMVRARAARTGDGTDAWGEIRGGAE